MRLLYLSKTQNVPQIARIAADGVDVFYRHAGQETGPTHPPPARLPLVVLHVRLAVVPHLAAKGYRPCSRSRASASTVPAGRNEYTFANLTKTVRPSSTRWAERFAVYIFDCSAPTGPPRCPPEQRRGVVAGTATAA